MTERHMVVLLALLLAACSDERRDEQLRQTVPEITHIAHEHLTGQQIRRGVMAALRARNFGWTCDAPTTQGETPND